VFGTRLALAAAFALLPDPAAPADIPVTAHVHVVIDEQAFHRDVVAAIHRLHAGLPHTIDGRLDLATLEAELSAQSSGTPEWDRCDLEGAPLATGGPVPTGTLYIVGEKDCELAPQGGGDV